MKRILCVLLALLMLASVFTVAVSADDVLGDGGAVVATADEATADEATADESTVDETEPTEPEEEPVYPTEPQPAGTYRYYFYLPDQWVNEYASTAGIYWWEGSISGEYWPGSAANYAGVDGVYYYDVATDTPTIIWNNHLDGGMDNTADIYTAALQTIDVSTAGYPAGVHDLYPEGLANFDGMIYVIDLDNISINSFNGKTTYGGEWYYYYGSGQYGTAPTKAEADVVYTDKSFGEWATPDEEPTEPVYTEPTEEPVVTEPTEAPVVTEPTEAPVVTEPTEAPVVTEPTEEPEATEDEATTDEATTDEATKDEATEDEATPDEPTPDESTPDESEPIEPGTDPGEEYELGDVNRDGVLNIKDATAIQKNIAKLLEFDDDQMALADINGDNEVNIKDVTYIQKKIAKLI